MENKKGKRIWEKRRGGDRSIAAVGLGRGLRKAHPFPGALARLGNHRARRGGPIRQGEKIFGPFASPSNSREPDWEIRKIILHCSGSRLAAETLRGPSRAVGEAKFKTSGDKVLKVGEMGGLQGHHADGGLPKYWYVMNKGIMMDNFGLPKYLYLGNKGIMLDNVGLPMYLIKVFGVLEYLNKILRRSSMQKVFGVP